MAWSDKCPGSCGVAPHRHASPEGAAAMSRAARAVAPRLARPTGSGRAPQVWKAWSSDSANSASCASRGSSNWTSTSPTTNTGSPSGG
eukprot:508086-Alexandrium_andersonii.AAC.1